ncbi:MAG: histidine kinase [Tetrasphaera sp.]
MDQPRASTAARIGRFFGVDDPWLRPRPPIGRRDRLLAALVGVAGLLGLELIRSVAEFDKLRQPVWMQWLVVLSGATLLVGRRRWPLVVAALAALHMFVVGVTMPVVMGQLTLQIVYFCAILSGVAWARDRRVMLVVVGIIVVFMFAWIAVQFALGSAIQEIVDETRGRERSGIFAPVPAAILATLLINIVYFGGAVLIGQAQWRSARQQALLADQAATIRGQADTLRRQAVIDERLRIARELHDVVGHHVSVIGIQAGAARRVLGVDPPAAESALGHIEESSREAITQLRSLLGTLRDLEPSIDGSDSRAPEPGITDLPALVAERSGAGLAMAYEVVESSPGAAGRVPRGIGLSLYRVAQEALANIARHSSAATARVVVRVDESGTRPYAEVEILDDGRPLAGTSGSGMGQLGMRERITSHGGQLDVGPRALGGYRVRARVPLGDSDV